MYVIRNIYKLIIIQIKFFFDIFKLKYYKSYSCILSKDRIVFGYLLQCVSDWFYHSEYEETVKTAVVKTTLSQWPTVGIYVEPKNF